MIGALVAGFLIAHGLLHPGVWSARLPTGTRTPSTPASPGRSRLPAYPPRRPGLQRGHSPGTPRRCTSSPGRAPPQAATGGLAPRSWRLPADSLSRRSGSIRGSPSGSCSTWASSSPWPPTGPDPSTESGSAAVEPHKPTGPEPWFRARGPASHQVAGQSCGTTTTGAMAWCRTACVTGPTCRPAGERRLRRPTTTMAASREASTR